MTNIKYLKLEEIKPLENNPRFISEDSLDKLKESISKFPNYFEARPIILSNRTKELVIIAGNQRYRAAKELKMKEIPTILLEKLTEEDEREIVIRDNVSNGGFDYDFIIENGEWDLDKMVDWGVNVPDAFLKGAEDIEEINEFNETVNFNIKCEDLAQLEDLQRKLGTSAQMMSYDDLMEWLDK